jgi:DNA-binding MarR family transcriptional regulator
VNDPDAKEERLTLELLDAIDRRSDVSQRHLARHMGVALGLANSYLRRCAKKGLVKVREAPANRYLYYLTPKGFAEKARLTARFLSTSLNFYRQAAESCSELFRVCESNRWLEVTLCGVSDLAEIAMMRSLESTVQVVEILDPHNPTRKVFSKPVHHTWEARAEVDAFIITDLRDPLSTYRWVVERLDDETRVLIPDVLGIDVKQNRLRKKGRSK